MITITSFAHIFTSASFLTLSLINKFLAKMKIVKQGRAKVCPAFAAVTSEQLMGAAARGGSPLLATDIINTTE